jgi:hypothetical protein
VETTAGVRLKFEPVDGGWNVIRPLQGPPGLALKVDGKWLEADYRTSIKLTNPVLDTLEVNIPTGQPWSQIVLTLEKIGPDGTVISRNPRSFFVDDAVSRRWAGVFVDRTVRAFGAEPARFWLTGSDPARPWTRIAEFSLAKPSPKSQAYVVDMDIFGRMLAHVTPDATSL